MTISQPSSKPEEYKPGETACGARILVTSDSHFVHYRDEVVYFCAEDCKLLYDEDPLSSCMAARILSGR